MNKDKVRIVANNFPVFPLLEVVPIALKMVQDELAASREHDLKLLGLEHAHIESLQERQLVHLEKISQNRNRYQLANEFVRSGPMSSDERAKILKMLEEK